MTEPSHSRSQAVDPTPSTLSFFERVGWSGVLKLSFGALICVANVFFYTMLPLAGLGLLPFLFFGCVLLLTGLADDAGYYR